MGLRLEFRLESGAALASERGLGVGISRGVGVCAFAKQAAHIRAARRMACFMSLAEVGIFVNQHLSIVRIVCVAGVNFNRVRGTVKLRDLRQSFASRSIATEIFR